jgi:hypothetical protein
MTESFISLVTAGFVVYGIILLVLIAVDAVHQVVWNIARVRRDDRS